MSTSDDPSNQAHLQEGGAVHHEAHEELHNVGNEGTDALDLSAPGQDEETPSLPPRPESETASIPPNMHERVSAPALQEENESPEVAALRAMFPDFDAAVLQSVLESVGGDQERAIDVLLGMSDPDYVSTAAPAPVHHDLALDEQLARQLALEDQQQAPRARGQSWPHRGDLPYQPRQGTPSHPQQQLNATGTEHGDFQELQATLGRMAESGKRTFSSIVSKAKAKINEYNQQQNQQRSGQPSTSPQNPQWGATSPAPLDRHTATEAYNQDYYAKAREDSRTPPPISLRDNSSYGLTRDYVKGYDAASSESMDHALTTQVAEAMRRR
ncbi:uncharacterized protein LAESUDRAFT_352773 [Laetiporus sulphureus 93-53]|uniref:CUE domain-containing protein n=1 Tax=Laetiporus sulphureus 93-53 TaxID=1314785 RepID=A0A165GV22_9APHY|nr:uncharacterized protein LAESUDRAFT_352773 [Laetiporus sulphureus 93-53]KZT10854.1 hypothetical protein LAESUDRAFT_352773 [Laetiporus sulphureus 93-53]